MSVKRQNPISIDVLEADIGISEEELEKQIKELAHAIRAVDLDLLGWLRKQAELVRLRIGDRRPRNVPWKGASNINVPLIDGIIRRWRPGITSLVLDADPPAYFTAQSSEDFQAARLAEQFFSYLLLGYMDITYSVVQLADLIAWRGHAYTRTAWKYETAREARVVPVDHLFPNGVQATIEQMQAAAVSTGQEPPSPEDIVVTAIEQEYDLDRDDRAEGPMLLDAAQKILEGRQFIRLVYRRVCVDRPDWAPIDPLNVIVPQNQDPENADFFCIIHTFTANQMRAMAIDGSLPMDRVAEVLENMNRPGEAVDSVKGGTAYRAMIQDIMDRQAGKVQREVAENKVTNSIPVWEIYCRLDLNGDGEKERAIVWYAPTLDKALAVLDYPFPFDSWPITYFPFEACPRPIDNRGIADMLRPLQKIVSAMHNARLDAAQIVLAPVLVMRQTGGNFKKTIKWRPGAIIPVAQTTDLQPLVQNLAILNGLLQEEQVNQRMAESYVGVFDATLTNLQQRAERRTAAEVQAIQGLSANIFGLDARIVQVALSKSFTKIWQLYADLGPRELFFRVVGEDMPRIAKKSEIVRNYDIRAAGTPANTNRTFQLAALERIMSNPLTLPMMQNGLIDVTELFGRWVALVDAPLAKAIMRDPQQSAAVQQVLQAAQLANPQGGGGIAPIL